MVWLVVLSSFGFLLGSVLGSFLNVVARRTVAGESWWGKSRSRCDACGTFLTSSELIPLLSWLVQRGRCRTCGAAIPKSYFYVELVCALIGALVTARWGQALPEGVVNGKALLPLLLASTAAYSLYLNALTDLYSGYIFDLFALAPGALGLLLRVGGGGQGLTDGLLGAALGYGIIACIILLSRGGMGWGDAHLMAGLGSILGWKMTGTALYFGFLLGGFWAVLLLVTGRAKRKDAIPLGPFLALGGLAAILCGPSFLAWFGIASEWPWNTL